MYYGLIMGLEGQKVFTGWAYANEENFYSESCSIDMPESAVFVKTFLCDLVSIGKKCAVEIGIIKIRYNLPDNNKGRVNLDTLDWPNSIKTWYNPKMTHFTFAIKTRECFASVICVVDYWS